MLLEMVWNTESELIENKEGIEKKFFEKVTPAPILLRKRKFKRRFRESAIIQPRQALPIDESESDLCVILWRSVIMQALYDISGKDGGVERRLTRAEGLAWFAAVGQSNQESDFEYVCQLANLNSASILLLVKEIREKGHEILEGFNFRTLRKDSSVREGRKSRNNNVRK